MRKFRCGDKIKTIAQGHGVVLNTESGNATYTITVAFKEQNVTFTKAGFNHVKDIYRSLYHADEQFVDPPRPMKKVKVGGWFNIYADNVGHGITYFFGKDNYVIRQDAIEDCFCDPNRITTVYLETEIEVEE